MSQKLFLIHTIIYIFYFFQSPVQAQVQNARADDEFDEVKKNTFFYNNIFCSYKGVGCKFLTT